MLVGTTGFESNSQRRGKFRPCVQEGKMFIKGSKFYADWRTPDGVRHRRSFDTRLGAIRFENRQKRQNPRKARLEAAALASPQGRSGSGVSPVSSVASRRNSRSKNSATATSRRPSPVGAILAAAPDTPTQPGSGLSLVLSPRQVLQASMCLAPFPHSHGRSGRPRTKRVGVSPAQTSDCAGSSLVHST